MKLICLILVLFLTACVGLQTVSEEAPPTPSGGRWETYTVADVNLTFTYPRSWFVHEAGKALQITPNAQPTWSSFFDPDGPHGGPAFDLMHNLNRQMADTPLVEVENLPQGYAANADIEAITAAAALADRPDVIVGAYRLMVEDDTRILLVGAVDNPVADSPQPVIAMTGLVNPDDLTAMQPIFEAILRSLTL